MFIQKNNFIINCEKVDENFVNSLNFKEIYKKCQDFFNLDRILAIRIKFLYSAEEYNFFSPRKFEDWKCGFVGYPNMIFVISPSVIEKITTHKREDAENVIIHELAHIFYGNLKLFKMHLFEEGLATYLSFYEKHTKLAKKKIEIKGNKIKDYRKIYHMGFVIINSIIKKFGKEKLIEFLKTTKSEKEINEKSRKIFGISFNNLFIQP